MFNDYFNHLFSRIRRVWLTACLIFGFALVLAPVYAQNISVGQYHSLAASTDGKIYTWGLQYDFYPSDGVLAYPTPVDISDRGLLAGKKIKKVAAGSFFSVALTVNGEVYIWDNPGSFSEMNVANSLDPIQLPVSNIKDIAAGGYHLLALQDDGTVYAFGRGDHGQLGDGTFHPQPSSNVVQVADLNNVKAISAGGLFSLALKTDGTVYAWGSGIFGQLGRGVFYDSATLGVATPQQVLNLSDIVGISAGGEHALALNSAGKVFSWGRGGFGQLGNKSLEEIGIDPNEFLFEQNNFAIALPKVVPTLENIIQISAGDKSSFALTLNRYVFAWGEGSFGNLGRALSPGTGEAAPVPFPLQVNGVANIVNIAAGWRHSLFLHNTGVVFGVGDGGAGQLGDGVDLKGGWYVSFYYVYHPIQAVDLDLIPEVEPYSGKILWEQWTNVSGGLGSIPFDSEPASVKLLTLFEAPSTNKDNFGSRISGFVHPPVSGNYNFFIASDDQSELWLSTSDDPANKVKIAFVNGYTGRRQWNKYPSQKSAKIYLEKGQKYYIEALHKENRGVDNLAVAWQLPDGSWETPIPGIRLSPNPDEESLKPQVRFTNLQDGYTFNYLTQLQTVEAEASYQHGDILYVELSWGDGKRLAIDYDYPYVFSDLWLYDEYDFGQELSKTFVVKAVTEDLSYNTDTVIVNLNIYRDCHGPENWGVVRTERWDNLPAGGISTIPVDTPPSSVTEHWVFEEIPNQGNYFGTRRRGYFCVGNTGEYRFYISSDDHSELWLSSDDNPANKMRIAYVNGHTNVLQFDKYASQTSAKQILYTGQKYYFEVLHKENSGAEHLNLHFSGPGDELQQAIEGYIINYAPYIDPANMSVSGTAGEVLSNTHLHITGLSAYPNPSEGNLKIHFTAEITGDASVQIFNLNGGLVKTLFEGAAEKDKAYTIDVNTQTVEKGIYICKLTQEKKVKNIKLVFM